MGLLQVRVEHTEKEEVEVIIRCREETSEIKQLMEWFLARQKKIKGKMGDKNYLLSPTDIYYFESVDTNIFAYTKEVVCCVPYCLEKLEELLSMQGFFRCSKNMIVNLNVIEEFQSSIGNRITATLKNKECIIISRHYAKLLRSYLKEGGMSTINDLKVRGM